MPFLMLALLAARCQVAPPAPVELYRGASLYGSESSPNYQDVEDTTLEQDAPDIQHGGDYTLLGGPGHTILIRFGSLAAALGPSVRVTSAKLVLSATSIGSPRLHSIGVIKAPWGEGPFHTTYKAPKVPPAGTPPKEPLPPPPTYGATWKSRFANMRGGGWQSPGAASASDATPVADAHATSNANQLVVEGLGPSVQAMLADPGGNHGFALSFNSDVEFYSSECLGGKPRLVVTVEATGASTGGDLAIESIVPDGAGYAARVRNIGTEPVDGIRATWTLGAQEGSTLSLPGVLAPGQTKELHADGALRSNEADHRLGAITLRIDAAPNDHNLADKALTVYPDGLPLSVLIEQASLPAGTKAASARGPGLSNWVQAQLDVVNEIYLARSRYSFASEGCIERVRLAEIKEIGPTIDGPAPIGIPVELHPTANGLPYLDVAFIRSVLLAIGAPNLGRTAFPKGSPNVKVPGWNVGAESLYPDITGGGDTRFEGGVPSQILLPQAAIDDPILADIPLEPNGLLSADAVGLLNLLTPVKISDRAAARSKAAAEMPRTVFVDAADAGGRPFKKMNLDFFQSHAGVVDGSPAFTVTTSDSGAALLPRRTIPGTTQASVFGSGDLEGDGAFLVRASANGEEGWAWLKAWQLREAAFRGDAAFASVPLYFTIASGAVDRTINRAVARAVSDSSGSLPAKLSPLVDGRAQTLVSLPQKPGDWIEIDLNRDWTLGELRLTTLGQPMWRGFKVFVYQTGQKPETALPWATETDWNWSVANRGAVAGEKTTLAYNGPLVQIRYIRIVCTKPGPGALAQIEAFSTKAER